MDRANLVSSIALPEYTNGLGAMSELRDDPRGQSVPGGGPNDEDILGARARGLIGLDMFGG